MAILDPNKYYWASCLRGEKEHVAFQLLEREGELVRAHLWEMCWETQKATYIGIRILTLHRFDMMYELDADRIPQLEQAKEQYLELLS